MVVLIGGSSHTGKTLAAQRLLEKYSFPYLSIDHLKMGLIRSGVCPLSPMSSDRELTPYLWNIVREIIKTAIENSQNLTIEGCYIPFDWAQDFPPHYLEHIRYTCLIFSEAYIHAHYADILDYANVIEQRLGDDCCTEKDLLGENIYHLAQCRRFGHHYLLIDGQYSVNITL